MHDGGDNATVSAFYNGYVLVVLKTHGRRGSSVEKQRFTLSETGDLLTVEITHIDPNGKPARSNGKRIICAARTRRSVSRSAWLRKVSAA